MSLDLEGEIVGLNCFPTTGEPVFSRSYWGCRFSIGWLFRGPDSRTLHDSPAPKSCKLWTFTFADPAKRGDAGLALDTWGPFGEWLRKTGKSCVRVLEQGERGAWHFHCVTGEWWDVDEVRKRATALGFGRINVKDVPLEQAWYVAKYVGKAHGKLRLPAGRRQWACVGFKGVSLKNVRLSERSRVLIPDTSRETLVDVVVWNLGDTVVHRRRLRIPPRGVYNVHMIELKPTQVKEIATLIARGDVVTLAEYRGCNVKTQQIDDWKTKQKVARVVVEHAVEINAAAVVVSQWLPASADASTVKPAANKGDIVCVFVQQMKKFRGQLQLTTEKIVPLSTLALA